MLTCMLFSDSRKSEWYLKEPWSFFASIFVFWLLKVRILTSLLTSCSKSIIVAEKYPHVIIFSSDRPLFFRVHKICAAKTQLFSTFVIHATTWTSKHGNFFLLCTKRFDFKQLWVVEIQNYEDRVKHFHCGPVSNMIKLSFKKVDVVKSCSWSKETQEQREVRKTKKANFPMLQQTYLCSEKNSLLRFQQEFTFQLRKGCAQGKAMEGPTKYNITCGCFLATIMLLLQDLNLE